MPSSGWAEGNGSQTEVDTNSCSSENFPDTLNCAEVEIFSQKKCEEAYPGKVNDGMICAGNSNGADTCQVSDFQNPPLPSCTCPVEPWVLGRSPWEG